MLRRWNLLLERLWPANRSPRGLPLEVVVVARETSSTSSTRRPPTTRTALAIYLSYRPTPTTAPGRCRGVGCRGIRLVPPLLRHLQPPNQPTDPPPLLGLCATSNPPPAPHSSSLALLPAAPVTNHSLVRLLARSFAARAVARLPLVALCATWRSRSSTTTASTSAAGPFAPRSIHATRRLSATSTHTLRPRIHPSAEPNARSRSRRLEHGLEAPALPEMVFGHSWVRCVHVASNTSISFSCTEALQQWAATCHAPPRLHDGHEITVAASKDWTRERYRRARPAARARRRPHPCEMPRCVVPRTNHTPLTTAHGGAARW